MKVLKCAVFSQKYNKIAIGIAEQQKVGIRAIGIVAQNSSVFNLPSYVG